MTYLMLSDTNQNGSLADSSSQYTLFHNCPYVLMGKGAHLASAEPLRGACSCLQKNGVPPAKCKMTGTAGAAVWQAAPNSAQQQHALVPLANCRLAACISTKSLLTI